MQLLCYILIKLKILTNYPLKLFVFFIPEEYVKKFAYSINPKPLKRYKIKQGKFDTRKQNSINLIGPILYNSGYGEHCRSIYSSLKTKGLKIDVFNQQKKYNETTCDNLELCNEVKKKVSSDISIFAQNPMVANKFLKKNNLSKFDSLKLASGYNICYGYTDMSQIPQKWINICSKFDEIWAPTRFVQDAISKCSISNVIHMPIAIDFKLDKKYQKSDFNLEENNFIFLFCFDLVGIKRKNIFSLLESFKLFKDRNKNIKNANLVLKITNYGNIINSEEIEKFKQEVKKDDDIIIINENFDKEKLLGLISICDCYISLHRLEGFGFTIAEAMKLQKPVIVTNYSGNLDFTNSENSFLANYNLVKVTPDEYEFIDRPDVWAEVDINHVVKLMAEVYNNKELANQKALKAKKFIDENHNFEIVGNNYYHRLKLLGFIN